MIVDEYKYDQRFEGLVDAMKKAELNDTEFNMIYGILDLSTERNKFYREYNKKIDNVILKNKKER